MILSRTYTSRKDIPRGAEALYTPTGNLFILNGAKRDFVADNPWEIATWNLTEQGRFIAAYGMPFANAFAAMAGTRVGATKPSGFRRESPVTVLVQRRDVTTIINNGGGGGAGLATALATKVN